MLKQILSLSLLMLLATTHGLAQTEKHDHTKMCGSTEYLQSLLLADPTLQERLDKQETEKQKYLRENDSKRSPNVTITIPVIVHVVYYKDFWGNVVDGISNSQIQSILNKLNADYNGNNGTSSGIPAVFQSVNAGNTGIQFCLTKRDPNNNAHSGIIRKLSSTNKSVLLMSALTQMTQSKIVWAVMMVGMLVST